MNRRGGRLIPIQFPRAPRPTPEQREGQQQSQTTEASTSNPDNVVYEPGPKDISDVKLILEKVGNLPPEVVDIILDHAEYWACTVASVDYRNLPNGHLVIRGSRPAENQFLLRSEPIGLSNWSPASPDLWRRESTPRLLGPEAEAESEYPRATLEALADDPVPSLEHPVRKIVFDIVSRDQGWGGERGNHGAYNGSFTWFDAGLERFDRTIKCPDDCPDRQNPNHDERNIPTCAIRPLWPVSVRSQPDGPARYHHDLHASPEHCIQRNRLAARPFQHHHVEWKATDDIDPRSAAAEELKNAGRGRATGNGEFVRNLKLGDIITVWGRARFGSWTNNIERVEVKVYWAV
ncbi:hypothetical protein DL766_003658 [Monosporascus sp. MC13-8B]|uniref:Uncharacterized protein n=1 Tax=Monosporascus cannonballus TaxID=155416 RepID=A0ABY0GYE7_9PEZI|nr:hypothetical protein DL762_007758 [Monosporascus cannonballus]RYO93631.1 hypothetical protein DL763_004306 [Monosporascus cannonballus]RYP33065.1 hypothetical protein DL766_003658 [Monosporascus sp. MC13-8B]